MDYPNHNPGQLIYNFSSQVLTDSQTSLLHKGLTFAIPPKKLGYENHFLPFEMLFRNLKDSSTFSNDDLIYTKSTLQNIAMSSYRFCNKNNQSYENLSKEEHNAFLELISLENIVIQKADKGNVVVLVDKEIYLQKMKYILDDKSKFNKRNISDKNIVQTLIETQDRIKTVLDPLKTKGVISEEIYNKISSIGSQPGRLYGLCKVHKESVK